MADDNDPIGAIIDGKYRLERLIGRGGMGAVYAARQVQLDRTVAVKLIRPDVTADERAVARFNREARAAARIDHPNAVRVYDFGATAEGAAFIVMEFVDGIPLRSMMRRTRVLPLDVTLQVMWQASSAIAAAHAQGIVHRDLKPENFMVRVADDGAIAVKVVDFGLAKLVEGEAAQITSPAEMIGTPRYMAPEQFSGDTVDERVDVYALGVILFEMLTGRPPFDGTFSEVVGKHLYAEPPTLASLGVELPEGVQVVVGRALAKRPSERTGSVLELARHFATCFGIEVPAGTALIVPSALTSRSGLFLEGFMTDEAEPEAMAPEAYETRVEAREAPAPAAPSARAASAPLDDPLATVVAPRPPAAPSRRLLWAIPAAAGLVVLVVAAVALVGLVLFWRAHRTPTLAETPATPGAAPAAAPAPAPTLSAPPDAAASSDAEDDDDGAVNPEGLSGVPFYIDGRLVVYGEKGEYPRGTVLEIRDHRTGRRERFALEPNEAGTKWTVASDARSEPGGLSVEDLVPAHVWVETVIRKPDGTVAAQRSISRPDE